MRMSLTLISTRDPKIIGCGEFSVDRSISARTDTVYRMRLGDR
jgi:hypothetical protein